MKLASFYPRMRIHFVDHLSHCAHNAQMLPVAPVRHPGNPFWNYAERNPSDITTSFLVST